MPQFRNRPNARFDLHDGQVLYHSRSVAITAITVAHDAANDSFWALVGLRGPAVDHSDLWCLTCGYLDWDESLHDAVRREVFEEANVDLADLEARGKAVLWKHPIFVQSDPTVHRQNVTARFLVSLGALVPPSTQNAEPGEVEHVEWMPLSAPAIAARSWAFQHDQILNDLVDFFASEAALGKLDGESPRRFYSASLAR